MSALFISLLTLVLILISAFIVLIVLMQRTSQSGGMGAALGGGAAESAFGSDTTNVLTKATIYGIIAFFVVALGLYLIYQANADDAPVADKAPVIKADVEEVAETVTTVEGDSAAGITVSEIDAGTVEPVVESVVEEVEATVNEAAEAAPAVQVEAPAVEPTPAAQ